MSRSSLVCNAVRAILGNQLIAPDDLVNSLIGRLDIESDEDIDSVIYGLD